MQRKAASYLLLLVGISVVATGCVGEEPPEAGAGQGLVTQRAAVNGTSKVTMCNVPRYTKQTTVRLCGYTTPGSDGAPVASVWFTVDGGDPIPAVPEPSGGFVDTSTVLSEGTHTLRLSARSAAGNVTFEEKTVTVDLTPPVLKVLSPTSADTLESTVVNVTSLVSDATNVVVETQRIQSSTVQGGTGTVTHTIDLVNRGCVRLLVRAIDAAYNVREVAVSVYINSSFPRCPASCGDGVTNGTEVCDDGNTTSEVSCPGGQQSCTTCNATCTEVLNVTGSATPPSLVSINPTLVKAGRSVVLTGTDFASESRVTVGSTACVSTSFGSPTTLTCTVPSLADGTYAVTVTHPDGQRSTLSSALLYDTTPPAGGGTLEDGTYSRALTSSPALTWAAFTDAGSGVDRYEYAVGTTAGGTQTKGWTPFTPGTGPGTTLTGLTLASGTTYYPSIRAYDGLDNVSTLTGNGWTVDATGPSAPTGLNDGAATLVSTTAPTATWTASTDSGGGVAFYELAIGTSVGGTNILNWTPIGNVTSAARTGLSLAVGTTYYTSVRATDTVGNVGPAASGDGWTYSLAGPTTLVFLPMDNVGSVTGENASTDFVNFANAGASFRPVLAPTLSTVTPRFGGGSGRFKDGHLTTTSSAANVIGNSDFTIELWVKYSGSLGPDGSVVVSGNGWDISLGNTFYNDGATFTYGHQSGRHWGGPVGWGKLTTGTWHHLSVSRAGTSLYTHLNGVLRDVVTLGAHERLEGLDTTSTLTVGNFGIAYIDDLLITVGGVKHTTANFTPTRVAHPHIYLPMDGPGDGEHLSADFRNLVPGGIALTPTGAPFISSSSAGCGGCGNFKTGGTLSTPLSGTNVLGTRDFTIEFWVHHSALDSGISPVVSASNGTDVPSWDISLGGTRTNRSATFGSYASHMDGTRLWGGDIGWGELPLNTWTHLSLTRLGTQLITHKNGLLVQTRPLLATDRLDGPFSSTAITLGTHPSYLDDFMMTVGTARHTTANFPVVRAPNFPRLVTVKEPYVYLPLDGANGSTDFKNLAANGVVFHPVGTPSLTTTAFRFGGASGNFRTGSLSTAATASNVIGTRDFTIEFWVNFPAWEAFGTPVLSGNGWDISLGNSIYNNAADFAFGNQNYRWDGGIVGWGVLTHGTWTHLAISRSQNRLYTHKNGVLVSTAEIAPNAHMEGGAATSALVIGQSPSYLDDVMLTLGSAKYTTANFPVAQLPKPFMYFPMDGADLSTSFTNYGSGPAVTPVSSPTLTTSTSVYGGASANLMTGSLTTAASSGHRIGTQDFTIEFWVKHSALGIADSTVLQGTGWDITLGNTSYNNGANFAYYVTQSSGYRHWGGDIGWGVLPYNTWTHLSLTRLGTRLMTHKNGVLVSTVTIPANAVMEGPNTTSTLQLGPHRCHMDDLLVTIGRARHTTANFPVSF